MKINFNLPEYIYSKSPAFKGYSHQKNERGQGEYEFNFPYDEEKYDAYLEIYALSKDYQNRYYPSDLIDGSLKLKNGGLRINLNEDLGIGKNEPFAYRYRLQDKYGNSFTKTDAGELIGFDDKQCNLVVPTGAKMNKGGSMLLLMPESYNVGPYYDKDGNIAQNDHLKEKVKKSNKTFANNLGGTLAGVEEKIPELEQKGYSRIVSTPFATDDTRSAHGYWIRNAMQMSQSLGNINNYASLQKKLFAAGINLVADGAFVNEGIEGIHFKDVLKNKTESPYYHWFRAQGIEDGPYALGVIPKNTKVVGCKIVNAPYLYEQDSQTGKIKYFRNSSYESTKPTIVQILHKGLSSEENYPYKAIKNYDKFDSENPYEINTHNDTVIPYELEIKPEALHSNILKLKEYNQNHKEKPVLLNSHMGTRFIAKTHSAEFEEKFESGFETWDANTDIAKLRFYYSPADLKFLHNIPPEKHEKAIEMLKSRSYEVQDYAVTAGKYWTQKTSNILMEHVAQNLGKINKNDSLSARNNINDLIDEGILPKSLKNKFDNNQLKNIIEGNYNLKKQSKINDLKESILSGLMGLPLDSIEFGDDITAVLGYPYISKRATSEKEVGISRYVLYKTGDLFVDRKYEKTYELSHSLYEFQLKSFATEILYSVNNKLYDNRMFEKEQTTDLGKYVLPIYLQDIAKFAIIKSLAPDTKIKVKQDGEIIYDYEELKDLTLKDIGVSGLNPEEVSVNLLWRIKKGISKISERDKKLLADSILMRVQNTNVESYRLSEAIIDKAQAGLDWRIDASKDIGDIDTLRNAYSKFDEVWDDVKDFWRIFTGTVRKQNPNAYIVAEVTDEFDLHNYAGMGSKYSDGKEAVKSLLKETGMDSTANYTYLFTDLAKIFGKGFEDGTGLEKGEINNRIHNLLRGERNYLNSSQLSSLLYSYTFAGNHDKPRALHCLALDMELFHSNFEKLEHKKIAASIINKKIYDDVQDEEAEKIPPYKYSNKAIAMADAVRGSIGISIQKTISEEKRGYVFQKIAEATADLATGNYLGEKFSPDAFGTKPLDKTIDMVIKQAEREHGLELTEKEREDLVNESTKILLFPAMSKLKGLMSFLVSLPGNPTLFAGDDLGLTGYDEKCKNVYLQNRNIINWDILTEKNKEFFNDFYNDMTHIMRLRARPELQPLNTGAPFLLATKFGNDNEFSVTPLLRQDTNGAMTISLLNTSGISHDRKIAINQSPIKIDSIPLHSQGNAGLPSGLRKGTIFRDLNDDNHIYVVCKKDDSVFIKRFDNPDAFKHYSPDTAENDNNFIWIDKPAMILYHTPGDVISFTGRKNLNPTYNFVSNPYAKNETPVLGQKLKVKN